MAVGKWKTQWLWLVFPGQQQKDAGFAGRLKLKVKAVSTLKGHKSKSQEVSETVLNVETISNVDMATKKAALSWYIYSRGN